MQWEHIETVMMGHFQRKLPLAAWNAQDHLYQSTPFTLEGQDLWPPTNSNQEGSKRRVQVHQGPGPGVQAHQGLGTRYRGAEAA